MSKRKTLSFKSVLSNTWYGDQLGSFVRRVGDEKTSALCLSRNANSTEVLLLHARCRGLYLLLAIDALCFRRRVVVLEFIRNQASSRNPLKNFVIGFLLSKATIWVQVMTEAEAASYKRTFKHNPIDFVVIKWPLFEQNKLGVPASDTKKMANRVLASGRASTDWRTIAQAYALDPTWDLVIVASEKEREFVQRLFPSEVKLLFEIPQEEHDLLLSSAEVYLLVLKEDGASAGQIRLMKASSLKTAVIATNIKGLDGYLVPGKNCLTVSVHSPTEVSQAVRLLLDTTALRTNLEENAYQIAKKSSLSDYLNTINRRIGEVIAPG